MKRLESLPLREGAFIEPMECLGVPKLPDGSHWVYEIKLDGYESTLEELRVTTIRLKK